MHIKCVLHLKMKNVNEQNEACVNSFQVSGLFIIVCREPQMNNNNIKKQQL